MHAPMPPVCGSLLPRGVYRAPVLGPNYETILFAVNSRHQLIEESRVYIPAGEDVFAAKASLWRLLDAIEPEHSRRRWPRATALMLRSVG